jgi:hypothetical protein
MLLLILMLVTRWQVTLRRRMDYGGRTHCVHCSGVSRVEVVYRIRWEPEPAHQCSDRTHGVVRVYLSAAGPSVSA